MKKIIIAILALSMTTFANAQSSLLNSLKNAAASAVSNATGSSAAGDLVSSLLGTGKVSAASLQGTWKYTQPCIAFESKDLLTTIGSTAVSSKAQSYLNEGLKKVGFTAGKVTLTFDDKNNVSITVNGRTSKGTYTVEGSNLNITFTVGTMTKSVKMNCKLSGGNLQLAMNTSKLITLIQAVAANAGTAVSQLNTIGSLTKSVEGMYMGLQFAK